MKKPNEQQQQLEHELQFAQQQVESGRAALRNPDIDPKVAERVENAVAHWEKQQQRAQNELDLLHSSNGTPKQSQR